MLTIFIWSSFGSTVIIFVAVVTAVVPTIALRNSGYTITVGTLELFVSGSTFTLGGIGLPVYIVHAILSLLVTSIVGAILPTVADHVVMDAPAIVGTHKLSSITRCCDAGVLDWYSMARR